MIMQSRTGNHTQTTGTRSKHASILLIPALVILGLAVAGVYRQLLYHESLVKPSTIERHASTNAGNVDAPTNNLESDRYAGMLSVSSADLLTPSSDHRVVIKS